MGVGQLAVAVAVAVAVALGDGVAVAQWQWDRRYFWVIASILIGHKSGIGAELREIWGGNGCVAV
jgi:type IV secretory pathway VirB2 component (pilin)